MKRPRALDLDHASHISARALEAVLQQVRNEGVPEHFSAAHQRREKQRLLEADGLFGPVIRDIPIPKVTGDGTTLIAVAHPLALLQKSMNRSHHVAAFVGTVLRSCDDL